MAVTTRFYNAGVYVTSTARDDVTVAYDASASPVLKYSGDIIDEVQSDADSSYEHLTISVNNGSGWPIKDVKAKLSNSAAEEHLNMALGGSGWTIKAWYPASSPHTASWSLSNVDGPEVKLKVVVKRV